MKKGGRAKMIIMMKKVKPIEYVNMFARLIN